MITQVTCPACSTTLRAKSDLAGKRCKCPNCHTSVLFSAAVKGRNDQEDSLATPRWLVLGVIVVISLATGLAATFVFGHRVVRSDNIRQIAEVKANAERAIARADTTARTEVEKEKKKLEDVVKEHDQQLAKEREQQLAKEREQQATRQTIDDQAVALLQAKARAAADRVRPAGLSPVEKFLHDGTFIEGVAVLPPLVAELEVEPAAAIL